MFSCDITSDALAEILKEHHIQILRQYMLCTIKFELYASINSCNSFGIFIF